MTATPEGAEAPRRAPTRRSARTRERILAAATEVFARRGFHGTRVADIAELAGIAYGLVYHHFKNKEEILSAIFAERWGDMVRYLYELGGSDLKFEEKISKMVHFLVETYRHEPHLMTVMINEISRSYEFIESHDIEQVLVAFDAIEAIIRGGIASGEVREEIDAQLATYSVLGVVEMVLTGYVIGRLERSDREDFLRDERQLTAMLVGMLAK